ncbi:MAG: hypothetical protein QHH07_12665 [Sedimentisphaerales bacterium]|nr:hypothetical protein [Sedimentisphaerales bacterium]
MGRDIVVTQPGPSEKQALSILSEPNDLVFVVSGLCNTPRTVAKLEQVVEKCKGSIIARLCAARLGIETCRQLEKMAEQGQVVSAKSSTVVNGLAKRANGFLAMAAGLPDEFPIREEVMYSYGEIQALLGNLEQVVSICEETLAKYPRSKNIDIVRATLKEAEEKLKDKQAEQKDKSP